MEINRECIDNLAEAIRIADLTGCGRTKIPTPDAKEIFEILSEHIKKHARQQVGETGGYLNASTGRKDS